MKDFLLVILTIAAVVVVARLVLKKVNSIFVFLASGIVILIVASFLSGTSVLGKDTLGNLYLDAFGYIASSFESTVSGVGAIIMTVTGYSAYMNHIKASGKLAFLATKR